MSEQPSEEQQATASGTEAGGALGSDAGGASAAAGSAAAPSGADSTAFSTAPEPASSAATGTGSQVPSSASGVADTSQVTQTGTSSVPVAESIASAVKSQRSTGQAAAKSATGGAVPVSESPKPSPPAGQRRKRMKLGELDLSTAKIGFLGAGKMAESTINGLIHYGEYLLSSIEQLLDCGFLMDDQPEK